jgi:hypothetical protein
MNATYLKHFHLLKGAKIVCSTILTGPLATTWKRNKSTGKAGLLLGCRVKDLALKAISVMDMGIIIMVTAGADQAVLSDVVSAFLASVRAVVGVSPMNSSLCVLRLRKLLAFS